MRAPWHWKGARTVFFTSIGYMVVGLKVDGTVGKVNPWMQIGAAEAKSSFS